MWWPYPPTIAYNVPLVYHVMFTLPNHNIALSISGSRDIYINQSQPSFGHLLTTWWLKQPIRACCRLVYARLLIMTPPNPDTHSSLNADISIRWWHLKSIKRITTLATQYWLTDHDSSTPKLIISYSNISCQFYTALCIIQKRKTCMVGWVSGWIGVSVSV